jgi:hypothetical protein
MSIQQTDSKCYRGEFEMIDMEIAGVMLLLLRSQEHLRQ